ncbi:hypothetical protein PV328_010535 [Microctonus aethiopoides]|uniref:TIMELESS-interacting protein n=1 Tax=Microctonus aethiopoides TaxID=144406 RepID=A0AA39KQK3_9HYME|nr:hypothetical protein PV328_010535 [Microctonus aethiopoides]
MSHDLSDNSDHFQQSEDEANNLNDENEPQDDNEPKENDETARRIDPETSRKRIVRKTIPKLNTARLRGPKGIQTIEKYFEGFKFNGKGHEKNDLDRVMKRLEHWSHRLFPKYQFDDFLDKVEVLGAKRDLQTFLTKYRRDDLSDDLIITNTDGDMIIQREPSPEPADAFDLLIAEQIEKTKQVTMLQTPKDGVDTLNTNVTINNQTPTSNNQNLNVTNSQLSNDEIKKRIERNRQLAIERRLAKLKKDEEMKRKKTEESSEIFGEISQSSNNELEIIKTNSFVESEIISNKEISQSFVEKINSGENSTEKILNNTELNSTKINSNIVETDLILDNQNESNEEITNSLLTDEELNKTIDDAVRKFMNKKHKLN